MKQVPRHLGNGIWFFDAGEGCLDFGNELSRFLDSHPNMKIISMTGGEPDYILSKYGYWGYIVVFGAKHD